MFTPTAVAWDYTTESVLEGFRANHVIELRDGRLCGVSYENSAILVWDVDAGAVQRTMRGHTGDIHKVIQLQDGRVCSCSDDTTIKLWSLESGDCEHTLTGHTFGVICVLQLSDGRLCSSSSDYTSKQTIRVWNAATLACELTIITEESAGSIVQLRDGRICCCFNKMSIYSQSTGALEQSWDIHDNEGAVSRVVVADAARVCTCSGDNCTIKVWSTNTGECERTIKGHTHSTVISILLLRNGSLCSSFDEGTLKVWNLDSGECEKVVTVSDGGSFEVLELADARLVTYGYYGPVRLIF